MGGPITLTFCKPTMNKEQAMSNNLQDKVEQEPKIATTTPTTITTSTPRNYRNFRGGFQWGRLRR